MVNKSNTFDVPVGVLNNFKTKTISRKIDSTTLREDDYQSQIRDFVEKAYQDDVLEDTGPWKAIVLRVDVKPVPRVQTESFQHHLSPGGKSHTRGQSPMLIHLKCRIPELHMHLNIPRTGNTADPNYPDQHIIETYPTFTAISDSTIMSKVKIGDVVIVDFADRKNYTDPIYVSPITSQKNQMVINVTTTGFGPSCPPSGIGNQGASLGGGIGVLPHQGDLSRRFRARNSNAKAVMFGDSQMVGTMGNFLQKYVESLGYTVVGTNLDKSGTGIRTNPRGQPRVSRSGSGVYNWLFKKPKDPPGNLGAYWHFLEDALKKAKPELVVAVLGGNDAPYITRADKYLDLANKIKSIAPNCKFLWFGPPPATLKASGSDSRLSKRPSRSAFANKLKSVFSGINGMTYIVPQDYMPNYFKGKNGDGLHVTEAGAIELMKNLKKQGSTGPIRSSSPQKKPAPGRSEEKNKQMAEAAHEEVGTQWKSQELLAAAKETVGSHMGSFADRGSAESWLKEKASALSSFLKMTKKDAYESIKNRDFISGFIATNRPGISSTMHKPLRLAEWEIITNQKHNLSLRPGSPRPAGTSAGGEYGLEVYHLQYTTGTSKATAAAADAGATAGAAKLNTIMASIKQLSYKFTAAQLVNMSEEPLQGPLALPPEPKCQPISTVNSPQPTPTTGPSYAKAGKYNMQESANLARRVNKCLKSKGKGVLPVDALVAFIGVESGYRKPSKNLVRFEPHVWYDVKNIAPEGQPSKYKRTIMLDSGIPYNPGRPNCKSKMIGNPFGSEWFRSYQGKDCTSTTRVDYISKSRRNAFNRAAKINLKHAIHSSSWGSFQVMGFNLKGLIKNAFGGDYKKFLNAFDNNQEELTIKMVCHYLAKDHKGILDHIRNKNWKRVAKIYNGRESYSKAFVKHLAKASKAGIGYA